MQDIIEFCREIPDGGEEKERIYLLEKREDKSVIDEPPTGGRAPFTEIRLADKEERGAPYLWRRLFLFSTIILFAGAGANRFAGYLTQRPAAVDRGIMADKPAALTEQVTPMRAAAGIKSQANLSGRSASVVTVPVYGNLTREIRIPETGRRDPFVPLAGKGASRDSAGKGSILREKPKPLLRKASRSAAASPSGIPENGVDNSSPGESPAPDRNDARFVLKAVISMEKGASAIISDGRNSYTLQTGGRLPDGYSLLAIHPRSAVLEREGSRLELKL